LKPSFRILNNPLYCPLDLSGEFVSQTLALRIVVGNGIEQFGFGRGKEYDISSAYSLLYLFKHVLCRDSNDFASFIGVYAAFSSIAFF